MSHLPGFRQWVTGNDSHPQTANADKVSTSTVVQPWSSPLYLLDNPSGPHFHESHLVTQVLATDSLSSIETQDSDTCNEENGPKFKIQTVGHCTLGDRTVRQPLNSK